MVFLLKMTILGCFGGTTIYFINSKHSQLVVGVCFYVVGFTPLKFNMEPENLPLEKEIPMHFQVGFC